MAQVQSQARKAAKLSTNPALDVREAGGSGTGRGGKGRGRGRGQAGRGRGHAAEMKKVNYDDEDFEKEDDEVEAEMEMEDFKKPAGKLKDASEAKAKSEKAIRKKEKFRKHVSLS